MVHRLWKAAVAGAIVGLMSASAAHATTYYLENVKFDDGTTATGSFSTNVSGFIDDYNIVTQTGSITGYDYLDDINATYNPGDATILFYHSTPSYDGFLTLSVTGAIDAANPAITLLTGGSSYECSSYGCPNGIARDVVSGSLTTVPEPASWGLFLVGCGALGIALRRRRGDEDAMVALIGNGRRN